ncbi:hypothetical protein CR513_59359, partial [Mucuna pruriens]
MRLNLILVGKLYEAKLKVNNTKYLPKEQMMQEEERIFWILSIGDAQYFITYIDDHFRKVKLKCLRIDNDGEYVGQFDVYYKTCGISHEECFYLPLSNVEATLQFHHNHFAIPPQLLHNSVISAKVQ